MDKKPPCGERQLLVVAHGSVAELRKRFKSKTRGKKKNQNRPARFQKERGPRRSLEGGGKKNQRKPKIQKDAFRNERN